MFAHKKNYGCAGYVDDPLPNTVCIAPAWFYSEFSCTIRFYYIRVFLQFYRSSCIPPALCGVFRTIVFFCLVYPLLEKKKNLKNVIHGGFGSTWGHNFYMGTQNGSKLET